MNEVPTILISSAGRRVYLVDWFREAFAALGLPGRVAVAEHDPTSAAAGAGDLARQLPLCTDPAYPAALLALVRELRPRLFLSLNDHELDRLHGRTDLAAQLRARGVLVPGLDRAWQRACADKHEMTQMLGEIGVQVPVTVLGGDREGIAALAARNDQLVVKHRRGSGSSGLVLVPAADDAALEAALARAIRGAPPRGDGDADADDVIVQPRLRGTEHGVDLVGDLRDPGTLRAVLARRKLRMRAGETDKAVTVAPGPFRLLAERLAAAGGLSGLIDLDVFLEEDGTATVVDINPRFGGGYPVMHLAGADVPRFCLAQAFGLPLEEGWQDYRAGTVCAKHEAVRVTGRIG
ncbi:ATP-grasp domain-containing protein [Brachybacterium hainanense]|uniref:ATP-grasp domain-containing protein n=1 Tax=Brachybacterium hainanense TaxID=1541174 RepID=A0ABV6R8V2_9MICO